MNAPKTIVDFRQIAPSRSIPYRALCGILALCAMLTASSFAQPDYVWKSVIAGGGGFVPGIIYHPTARGLIYARTDMGGAYRWDNSGGRWVPIMDMMDETNSDYMGVLSMAVDPLDTNRVYMECGKYTQSWATLGAVLSSTDRGNSWTINPLSVKVGGNEDGRGAGERLQVDPNADSILFMGTTVNGLWKSTDFGHTWTQVSSFSPTNVNFVLFDPSTGSPESPTQRIYVAAVNTAGQSLYRSENGGGSWSLVAGQPSGVMAIRAAIADTLLYLTFANYQGPNGATTGSAWKLAIPSGTWTNITPSTGSYGFSGVCVYPKNPNIVMVSTLDCWWPMDEVYRSTDGGSTWSGRLRTSTLDHSYAPYTSTITPHWLAALSMDPFDSSKVMFGTGYGIWASDNVGGATPVWSFRDNNFEEAVPIQIVSPPFTSLMTAMGDIDGFRHDNPDVSPKQGRYSPAKGTTLSIAFAGTVPSRLVKTYNSSPFGSYSTDGGSTWKDFTGSKGSSAYPKGTTAGGECSIAISADGSTIVWGPTGAAMSYSTDLGKSWTSCGGGVPLLSPVADAVNPTKFYALSSLDGKVWTSTDGGKSFSVGATGLPVAGTDVSMLAAVPGLEGALFICCGEGGLYRSGNSGHSATKISAVTAAYRVGFGRPLVDGNYPALYLHGTVNGQLGLFRSDDIGASWTRINDDGHQYGWIHQVCGDPRIYGRCYISAEGRGSAYGEPGGIDTTDNPSTFSFLSPSTDSLRQMNQKLSLKWSKATDPQGRPLTYVIRFFGPGIDTSFECTDTSAAFECGNIQSASSYILCGSVSNGFDGTASMNSPSVLTASILSVVGSLSAGIPASFVVGQNYPNPFNPSTTISYSLPRPVDVTVAIYDLVGREVRTIKLGRRPAGSGTVEWDGRNEKGTPVSTGVYVYRFLAGGEVVGTRKMLLLK